MYKGKTILGLIPARGGSKGLPKKNIKLLLGKPLIGWTIEQARKSKHLDSVIVNTDCERIADISRQFKAEIPFLRPAELAADTSRIIDAVLHALDTLEHDNRRYDYLALLEPTSPLRKDDDIDKAIEKIVDAGDNAESLVSIGEIALENPVYAKRIVDGYVNPYHPVQKTSSLRQETPPAYFPYGVIYMSKVPVVRQTKTVYSERIIPYMIERWQNYEINDYYDFICVEAILKYYSEEGSK